MVLFDVGEDWCVLRCPVLWTSEDCWSIVVDIISDVKGLVLVLLLNIDEFAACVSLELMVLVLVVIAVATVSSELIVLVLPIQAQ